MLLVVRRVLSLVCVLFVVPRGLLFACCRWMSLLWLSVVVLVMLLVVSWIIVLCLVVLFIVM